MKFDELDQKMRVFETASDYFVLPEIHMVARLDGRSFTRLTKAKETIWAPLIHFSELFTTSCQNRKTVRSPGDGDYR